jgi:inosine-uridine nucleoside N-ribohydrolase
VGPSPPAAGFTICVNPEAAQIALAPGLPPAVMRPDLTPKTLTPRARVKEMRSFRPPPSSPSPPGPMSSNASTVPDTAATAPPRTTLA